MAAASFYDKPLRCNVIKCWGYNSYLKFMLVPILIRAFRRRDPSHVTFHWFFPSFISSGEYCESYPLRFSKLNVPIFHNTLEAIDMYIDPVLSQRIAIWCTNYIKMPFIYFIFRWYLNPFYKPLNFSARQT